MSAIFAFKNEVDAARNRLIYAIKIKPCNTS